MIRFSKLSLLAVAGCFIFPAYAQDGLADEEVTLNKVDPAQAAYQHQVVQQQIVQQQAAAPYKMPVLRDDGLRVADLNDVDIDVSAIETLRTKISQGDYGNINSLLISHKGQLLLEDYWRAGEIDTPHYQFSITKNMMSNAIGKAIELGHIGSVEDKVVDYFPNLNHKSLAKGADRIKIKDLLTMRSGLDFDGVDLKAENVHQDNHAELYLTLSNPVNPGRRFKYQGADTDILNHILFNTTGLKLDEFIGKHYFTPMGISNVSWEKSVCGLTKASSGLFMTSRDMMKVGLATLNHGQFNDTRLLSEEWMLEATTPKTPNRKYGYFWWTENFKVDGQEVTTISGRGARGQFIYMMPDLELVVVVTSSNAGRERRAPFQFTPEYILPAFM